MCCRLVDGLRPLPAPAESIYKKNHSADFKTCSIWYVWVISECACVIVFESSINLTFYRCITDRVVHVLTLTTPPITTNSLEDFEDGDTLHWLPCSHGM